jgi:urease accessory protein
MLPGEEAGIALSVVTAAAILALSTGRPHAATWVAIAGFAVFHGHAHGAEIPPQASALAYVSGLVLATALLQVLGIAAGDMIQRFGALPRQLTGAALGFAGGLLLIG